MTDRIEGRRTVRRLDEVEAGLAAIPEQDVEEGTVIVGLTVAIASYPTAAGKVYGLSVQTLTNVEVEGTTVAFAAPGGKVLAGHLGGTAPPVGTPVKAVRVGGRWVFQYG